MNRTYRIIVALLLTVAATATAQRIDTIKANPDAKPLRKIWQVTGGEFGGGRVGDGFGSCGDIDQDGYEDWAVNFGDDNTVHIYYGSDEPMSTTPVMILDSIGGPYPVVGDFWGTGHKAVGFAAGRLFGGSYYYALRLFRTDSNRLDTAASVLLDLHALNPPVRSTPTSLAAADLDGDGYDELVMMFAGRTVNDTSTRKPEVWIYRGGAEFQVDSPTVVLRDSEQNDAAGYQMHIGRFDADERPDLAMGFKAQGSGYKVNFFFSSEGSPWNWSEPDRVMPMGGFIPLDCDGDGQLDMLVGGEDYRASLFLSGSGKDIRTRSLTSNDLDLTLRASTYYCYPSPIGYLSDSSRRYAMLAMNIGGTNYLFSGGPNGPDPYYDSYTGELYGRVIPVGDLTGDGWDEVMTGNSTVNFNAGIAMIYAGGPYIPRDPSLGVRAVAGEGHDDAMSVWPNPVTTELHIAWRGDLKRMPRRFAVHNILGQLVAQGDVESWRGEAVWQCADAPAGVYILSILDYHGEMIATTRVVKQ